MPKVAEISLGQKRGCVSPWENCAGAGLAETGSSVCRAYTPAGWSERLGKAWARQRSVGQTPPASSLGVLPRQHTGVGVSAGRSRDETAWFKDKNVSYSTIDPSTSVPKQSMTGRESPHSSLSSAQATLCFCALRVPGRWAKVRAVGKRLRQVTGERIPGRKKDWGQNARHLKGEP